MNQQTQVIQVGLGPIGNRLTTYLAERDGVRIVGAVDVDPAKEGRDIGELAGIDPLGVKVSPTLLDFVGASTALLTTLSSLEAVKPQILDLIGRGLNVVSTCEELAYPWKTHPKIAVEIDEAARQAEASVLGTGINPGFLMDFLPLAASGVCRRVESIRVERIQDASRRRLPFQSKIGAGLALDEFDRRRRDGRLRHVGLTESMHMLAARLGWELTRSEDVVAPVVASRRHVFADLTVEAGQALGVLQTGRGFVGEREVVRLVFQAAMGQSDPRDSVRIEGDPGFEIRIADGVNGDVATCAIAANAVPVIEAARSGLRTMADLPPISCASNASRG